VWKHSEFVSIKRVKGKGRGVFARKTIPAGTIIERVPVLVVALPVVMGIRNDPVLTRFCFLRNRNTAGIALGYGSLYNHSFRPNAIYEESGSATMQFRALRQIKRGEEITINYNGDPEDCGSVGFPVVEEVTRSSR
jgi:SET domain-containing protein